MDVEAVASQVVDAALKVHKALGPGLLESAYQACLAFELRQRGYRVECEVPQPICYDGHLIEAGYRIDMLVEESVIIENKVVDVILPVHQAQLLTYMRLRNIHIGFLINWNVPRIKDGLQRLVHNYHAPIPSKPR